MHIQTRGVANLVYLYIYIYMFIYVLRQIELLFLSNSKEYDRSGCFPCDYECSGIPW